MRFGLSSTCGILTATSCISTFVAALLHLAAFGSHLWVVSVEDSPFVSIGFHKACFDNCRDPYCPASGDSVDVVYNGCQPTRANNWYYQEIWWWLLPDWFIFCRDLSFANVFLIFLSFIALAVSTSLAFKGRYTTETNAKKVATALQIMLFIIAPMILAAIILNMMIMNNIYLHGFEREWMPMPEKNAFGVSFWLELTATILLGGAFLCTIYAGVLKTMWLHNGKDPRYSEDMWAGQPPPSPTTRGDSGASALGAALHGLPHRTV